MLEARGLCKSYGSRAVAVPQELSIYENLGTEANLVLFGALYGLSGALPAKRVTVALALVGLADRAKDKPSTSAAA